MTTDLTPAQQATYSEACKVLIQELAGTVKRRMDAMLIITEGDHRLAASALLSGLTTFLGGMVASMVQVFPEKERRAIYDNMVRQITTSLRANYNMWAADAPGPTPEAVAIVSKWGRR